MPVFESDGVVVREGTSDEIVGKSDGKILGLTKCVEAGVIDGISKGSIYGMIDKGAVVGAVKGLNTEVVVDVVEGLIKCTVVDVVDGLSTRQWRCCRRIGYRCYG